MRVTAGSLKGRQLIAPRNQATHPMGDRVRGALFNILGDISGLTVLDAFAGSGALAVEAMSRGAANVVAVDTDKGAITAINSNVEQLKLQENIKVTRANISSWSTNNPGRLFDLILSDPPYGELQLCVLKKLTRHLEANGTYVLSWPGSLAVPELQELQRVELRSYGDAQLIFYKRA